MSIRIPRLASEPTAQFPPVEFALRDPDGLLCFGGDLHPTRLMNAYRHGIFPWYSHDEPILWWSPDPRTVFDTAELHLSRRFSRNLRASDWTVRYDSAFDAVIAACAVAPRHGQDGTWITQDMRDAYGQLHRLGHAHSVEVFDGDTLVGGIYGVALANAFCGESMFSAATGGSKIAIAALCRLLARHGVTLLDAQVPNPHLASLGAVALPRERYLHHLQQASPGNLPAGAWCDAFEPHPARELA